MMMNSVVIEFYDWKMTESPLLWMFIYYLHILSRFIYIIEFI